MTYYINTSTGATSWEKPASATIVNASDAAALDAASANGGWSKVSDGAGAFYYYNANTQESQWDVPAGFDAAADDAAPTAAFDEWIEQFDPESKTPYYYNTVTGGHQWEIPDGFTKKEKHESAAKLPPHLRAALKLQMKFRRMKSVKAVTRRKTMKQLDDLTGIEVAAWTTETQEHATAVLDIAIAHGMHKTPAGEIDHVDYGVDLSSRRLRRLRRRLLRRRRRLPHLPLRRCPSRRCRAERARRRCPGGEETRGGAHAGARRGGSGGADKGASGGAGGCGGVHTRGGRGRKRRCRRRHRRNGSSGADASS